MHSKPRCVSSLQPHLMKRGGRGTGDCPKRSYDVATTSVRNTASPDLETGTLFRTLIGRFKASLRLISSSQSSRPCRRLGGPSPQTRHDLRDYQRSGRLGGPSPQTRRDLRDYQRRTMWPCPFECSSASASFDSERARGS